MCVHAINEDVNPGYWKNIIYVTHMAYIDMNINVTMKNGEFHLYVYNIA